MKTTIIKATLLFLTLVSCDNPRTRDREKQETPKALEDKSSSLDISIKRSDGDIVETLYTELTDKTPELKQLENKIEDLSKSETDSAKSFDNYNLKNQSYYNSTNRYIEQIKDSLLRGKIKALIANSLKNYNSSTSQHNVLLKSIETKNLTLSDLHTILKITKTLPIIEKFQKENLPTTKSLNGYLRQLERTIKYADTLSNQ